MQSRLPVASVAHLPTPKALLEASAFHVCPDGTESSVCHLCGGVSQTLCIRSLNLLVGAPSEAGAAEEKAVTLGHSNPVIATVDVSFFDINPASVDSPGAAVTHLATLLRTGGVCAIGLRIPSSSRRSIADDGEAADGEADDDVLATAAHLTEILHLLHRACIPVVVIGALDGPDGDGRPPVLAHIDLALLCGLVVVDATVLPTGERRSYFESENLRTTMARVVAEREARQGGFFVGFWETAGPHSGGATPEAAVVRRARKLAEHWSALVFFESSGGDGSCATSAFSFLRRTDVCEVSTESIRPQT